MQIDLEKIPPEGLDIHQQESASSLSLKEKDVEFKIPVDVSVSVNLTSGTLLVKGKLETKVSLVCSRCLKNFQQSLVNKDFSFDLDARGLTEVDITGNIREGIVILLPLKPLCRPDCHGLCPKCGQDLNQKDCGCDRGSEDIRWKELGKLKLN